MPAPPVPATPDATRTTRSATRQKCRIYDTTRTTRRATRQKCQIYDTSRTTRRATRQKVGG